MSKKKHDKCDAESKRMWKELLKHHDQRDTDTTPKWESARMVQIWLYTISSILDDDYDGSARWDEVVFCLFLEMVHCMQDVGYPPEVLHHMIDEHHNENCKEEGSNEST